MNNNGQFLLYDMLLAFMILLLVLVSMTYLLETNAFGKTNTEDYLEPRYLLDLVEDEGLLSELSNAQDKNDSADVNRTIYKIDRILSASCENGYSLNDESINTTLIDNSPNNYKEAYCRKKVINKHEYTLSTYR